MTTRQLASEWLGYARDDLRSADFLTQLHPQPREIICFHAQQCAEKSLKGMLVLKGKRPPRTHDLEELASLLVEKAVQTGVRESLEALNAYAVVTRYPSVTEVTDSDVTTALSAARVVLSVATGRIERS